MSEAEGEKKAPEGASAEEAAEQLRRIKVADLVVQATTGLVTLGFVRLAGDQLDFAQARLAIDSLKALEPIVREQVSTELGDELGKAVASLQLGYAEAMRTEAEPAAKSEPESDEQAPPAGDGGTE